jgi:hypothetical protein
MSTEGKVLTFPKKKQNSKATKADSKASVVDISSKRQEIIQEERRSVRRTILTEFIGVHTVVPGYGLQKCALYDISVNGLAFDLTKKQGHFQAGEEVAMRVYLNHKTYFTFVVQVRSSRFVKEEGVHRHGASVVKGTANQEALEHFIRFIETVSANLKTDHGDVIVSNLDQT